MPVYVYEDALGELSSFLHTALQQTLSFNLHITKDPKIACLFFVPIGMFSHLAHAYIGFVML